MTDETNTIPPPDEEPREGPEQGETKRTVRRVVPAPSPKDLADRRKKRLHEAQLENSRTIADALTTWDGETDLDVPVKVDTEFDGKLLAKYYRENGWPKAKYSSDSAKTEAEVILPGGKITFAAADSPDESEGEGSVEEASDEVDAPDESKQKPTKSSSKKSGSRRPSSK